MYYKSQGCTKFTLRCKSNHAHGCPCHVKFVCDARAQTVKLQYANGEGWEHQHDTPLQFTRGLDPHIKQLILIKLNKLPNFRPKCAPPLPSPSPAVSADAAVKPTLP